MYILSILFHIFIECFFSLLSCLLWPETLAESTAIDHSNAVPTNQPTNKKKRTPIITAITSAEAATDNNSSTF